MPHLGPVLVVDAGVLTRATVGEPGERRRGRTARAALRRR